MPYLQPKKELSVLHRRDILLRFLKAFHLVENPRPSTSKIAILIVFIVITYLDYFTITLIGFLNSNYQWKISLAYMTAYTASCTNWLVMFRNRKRLANFLRNLQDVSASTDESHRPGNLEFVTICGIPILASTIYATVAMSESYASYFKYLTYRKLVPNWTLRSIIVFLKSVQLSFLYPFATNLIALLFCTNCNQCCKLLQCLTKTVGEYKCENFSYRVQMAILKSKSKIVKVLGDLQDVFSLASLLVCLAGFSTCCSVVGSFVAYTINDMSPVMVGDLAYIACHSVLSVTIVIWTAGRVPVESAAFKRAFREKVEGRAFLGISENADRGLFELEDFVLTGGDVISFKRSLILTFIGTMLTYTFLMISSENKYLLSST